MVSKWLRVEFDDDRRQCHVIINQRMITCPTACVQKLMCVTVKNIDNPGFVINLNVDIEIEDAVIGLFQEGQVAITSGNCMALTLMSYQYQIKPLLRKCEDFHLSTLSPSTCVKLWTVASDHGCPKLEKKALELVREYFEDIKDDESFCYIDNHRVRQLINDRKIQIHSIHSLNTAIANWCSYDSGTRASHENELMKFAKEIAQRTGDCYCQSVEPEAVRETRRPLTCLALTTNSSPPENNLVELNITNGSYSIISSDVQKNINLSSSFCFCGDKNCVYAGETEQIWCYGRNDNEWKKLSNIGINRSGYSICCINGQMLVLGGYENARNTPTDRILFYRKRAWSKTFKGQKLTLIKKVHSCKCVAAGSVLYIFGKSLKNANGNGEMDNNVQMVNLGTSPKVTELITPGFLKNQVTVGCTVGSPDGQIFVVLTNGQVFEYNPQTGACKKYPNIPEWRPHMGAFIHNNHLYIFGGVRNNVNRESPLQSYCMNLAQSDADWIPCGHVVLSTKFIP